MTKPIGYYIETVEASDYFDALQAKYGAQLERMNRRAKLTFRAVLTTITLDIHIDPKAVNTWERQGVIEDALELVDDEFSDNEPEIAHDIRRAGMLPVRDIEGLIESLTSQIRNTRHANEA